MLRPMWDLACDVLTDAWRVEPEAAERALQLLVERNRIVAEGAGAVSVAAALYGPVRAEWKLAVVVVCRGCIDSDVLTKILSKDFSWEYVPQPGFSFTRPLEVAAVPRSPIPAPVTRVLSAEEVRRLLPMDECIEATQWALVAFADGTGGMPLR